ncbi:MAG: peptide ABC transporter substrate-binding protein, partial [Simkaniaceae bacterium]|nr:peptide ABC transporter substrate-binding protein [Simkaniaceae bacterium]
ITIESYRTINENKRQMGRLKTFLRLFFLATITAALVGCGKKKVVQENVLRINFAKEPLSIDPRKAADPATCRLIYMIYDGLTRTLPSGSVALCLAESVEVTSDRKQYKFLLKKTNWSNGAPIVARDFEYAWKSVLNPSFPAPNAFLLYSIKNARLAKMGKVPLSSVGIKAINDRELVVQLEKPIPYFLELVSFCSFFPISEKEELQNPDWASITTGSSPTCGTFEIEYWKHASDLFLRKSQYNWNTDNVSLDKVEISFVENHLTALQMFEKGKLDWMEAIFGSTDMMFAFIKSGHHHKLNKGGTFFVTFNMNDEIFNNINMRKAFAYAIDRQAIAENISNKLIANHLIPPIFRYQESSIDFFKDATPELAKAYFEKGLTELGLTRDEFPSFTYYYLNYSLQKQVAQALQNQWRETFGINIELQGLEMKLFLTRLFNRDYSIAQSGIIAQYSDPMNFLERFQHRDDNKNYPGWESPLFNQKLSEALNIPNPKLRQIKYDEAEMILINDMPIAPIYYTHDLYIMDENIQGVEVTPTGVVDFRNVRIKQRTKKE